jgi:hypothetical protein
MSPRSREFLERARERLTAARALAAPTPDVVISVAPITRCSTPPAPPSVSRSSTPRRSFVADRRFDADLLAKAHAIQGRREAIDYDAATVSSDEATAAIALTSRFVHEVAVMISP